jgi:hypothetical protein
MISFNCASSGVSGSVEKQDLKYMRCMRSHGVTNYPEPPSDSATRGSRRLCRKRSIIIDQP